MPPPRIAVVLAGGAARGAYEVGVLRYICEDIARALGRPPPIDVVCGSSVGAINACFMAAFADQPSERARLLERHWEQLRVGHVLRLDSREILSMARGLFSSGPAPAGRKNAILDPTGMQRLVATLIPFGRISDNLRAGHISALTVSTTQIATGRTHIFVERSQPGLPTWSHNPAVVPRAARINAHHALASAAIPFLFPPVAIDGEHHCDGSLRQNVPLSPARRLGADGMLVISPKYVDLSDHLDKGPEPFPGPLFLFGKVLNALLLDHVENDIDRLRKVTDILDAGSEVYGPGFVETINRQMGYPPERAMRPMHAVLIRASQDISAMATHYVRSPAFASRSSGMVARLLRRLADGGSDLVSYLLFDGEFARQLIELGRADARARHEELCRLWGGLAHEAIA